MIMGPNESDSSKTWALQYINLKYLLPIMDAIDDDASGRVTVEEVNRFTERLPGHLSWK